MEYFSTQSLFQAIIRHDVTGVKTALAHNADVNVTLEGSSLPLWLDSLRTLDQVAGRDIAYNHIAELIVPRATNVIAPSRYNSCTAFSDDTFSLRNHEAASLVLLAAAKESQGFIVINLPELFTSLGNAHDLCSPIRKQRKEKIIAIHHRASERLANPVTDFEKECAKALIGNRDYWLKPLAFPDLADLPLPNQAYLDTLHELQRRIRVVHALEEPFIKEEAAPMPDNVREAIDHNRQGIKEKAREIYKMDERGQAGSLRRPKPQKPANE